MEKSNADDVRNKVVGKVEAGEMTPPDAEAEAERRGCGALASHPSPDDFDPMREDGWTLPMAVAWIAWRSPDKVREWWDAYQRECRVWRFHRWHRDGEIHEDHFLEEPATPNLVLLRLTERLADAQDGRKPPRTSIEDALADLWRMLARGSVRATGIDSRTGERAELPPAIWRDLQPIESNGRDVLRKMAQFPPGQRYEMVSIDAAQLTQLWLPKLARPNVLPVLISPEGNGYMPLYRAAQWIATQGGTDDVGWAPDVWRDAYDELLGQICAGRVSVLGTRAGARRRIDRFQFAGCRLAGPFEDWDDSILFGDDLVLVSWPYLDEDHWFAGFDDSLRNRLGARWSRLIVRKDQVAANWPFGLPARQANKQVYRTGAPGRPSSAHLIKEEFKARCARGEIEKSLRCQATTLADWLRFDRPTAPPMTVKTVENQIRDLFHKAQQPRN